MQGGGKFNLEKASQHEGKEASEQDWSEITEVLALLSSPESIASQGGHHG